MKFRIVSDSSCDLPQEEALKRGIDIVSFYVSFDDENYLKEGKDISAEEFYEMMVAHADVFPKTSMPTIYDYTQAFLPHLERGESVLCICLNSAFSGSYQAACNARMMLLDQYPDAKICVVDSRSPTVLQGLFVLEAAALRDQGVELEEAVERLEAIRDSGRIFFTTNDLKYLAHGGRIGKAAAGAGMLLQMKPMIEYYDCELNGAGVVRGRKRSLQRCLEMLKEYVEKSGIDLKDYRIATAYGLDREEYDEFNRKASAMLGELGYEWEPTLECHIGATIGVHTGPYPIGIVLIRGA